MISAVQAELSEIAKLSVQDHDLIYEPISSGFRIARAKLSRLSGVLDDYVVRSTTAEKLNLLIQDVMTLPMH